MDYVSLLSVFSNETYNYSVTALEDSVTCNLDLDELRSMMTGKWQPGLKSPPKNEQGSRPYYS